MKSCCDEHCSTHGCNRGRNCPARIERVREAKQALDANEWQPVTYRQLKRLAKWLLTVLALLFYAVLAASMLS